MAIELGTDPRFEVDPQLVYRDPRPLADRAFAQLAHCRVIWTVMLAIIACMTLFPVSIYPLTPIAFIALQIHLFHRNRARLPLRIPAHVGKIDPGTAVAGRRAKNGEGILYFGNLRMGFYGGQGEQVWGSNDDSRTHLLCYGTTGAGKTESLLSRVFNSLCWGSGFIYVDGKADSELVHKVFAMARRCGREDDLLILNFMQAGKDSIERKKSVVRESNSMNPMARGTADFISSLITSLMPEASGDSAAWREKAVGMIEALIRVLVYLRYKKELLIDPGTIRDYISLEKVIKLGMRNDIPEEIKTPISSYLANLSGFSMKDYLEKGLINEEANKQHGYLSGQFTKLLGTLNDTYGHIFRHQLPEIDMVDIVLNNRILIVLIPSLEKSEVESQGLGRLVVSTLRLMMATALGSRIEGSYEDVIETKLTKAPMPYQVVMDEVGYYFTKGTAVMFAQARGLGFSMTLSGQDKPAMAKGQNKEEVESCIANTKFKECMALEDPGPTFDVFSQAAGEAVVSRLDSFEGQAGSFATSYRDNLQVRLESKKRLTVQELRDQATGQSTLLFQATLLRVNCFYLFGSLNIAKKKKMFLNQFVIVRPPTIDEMQQAGALERPKLESMDFERGKKMLQGTDEVKYDGESQQPVADFLRVASEELRGADVSPEEKGILLFMRLRQKLNQEPDPHLALTEEEENMILDGEAVLAELPLIGDPELMGDGPPRRPPASVTAHYENLQAMAPKPEVIDGLIEISEKAGAADPVREAEETLNRVAEALRYKEARTPREAALADEIREIYTALHDELVSLAANKKINAD